MERKNIEEQAIYKWLSSPNKKNYKIVSTMENSSSWKVENVALQWVNVEYPFFHTHDHYELLVIMEGNIIHTINNKNYELKAGNACLIRPNDRHCLHFKEKNQTKYLHINFLIQKDYFENLLLSYSEDILNHILETNDYTPFEINSVDLEYIKKCAIKIHAFKEYSEIDVILCKAIINRLLTLYIEQYYVKENSEISGWLNDFLGYLYDPESFNLSISELAKKTPYSHSRLYRIFKERFNMSLVEFHNDVKLNYAKEMLNNTNASTLDVCKDIGYYSLSHFNHAFKDKFGISPGQYRKRNM